MGTDYLAYALIDAVVDHFFPIVESLGESIEDMQESLLELPTREKLEGAHEFGRRFPSYEEQSGRPEMSVPASGGS